MVTSAARKIPFSSTSSAITCISALLRVTMRNAALKISATAAARVTSVDLRIVFVVTSTFGRHSQHPGCSSA